MPSYQWVCCCNTTVPCADCTACAASFHVTGSGHGFPCSVLNNTLLVTRGAGKSCIWTGRGDDHPIPSDVVFTITCDAINGVWILRLDHTSSVNHSIFHMPLAGNPCPPLGAWTFISTSFCTNSGIAASVAA